MRSLVSRQNLRGNNRAVTLCGSEGRREPSDVVQLEDQRPDREVPASMTRHRELPPTASRDELERELKHYAVM